MGKVYCLTRLSKQEQIKIKILLKIDEKQQHAENTISSFKVSKKKYGKSCSRTSKIAILYDNEYTLFLRKTRLTGFC
jgi:hypothetical protein